MTWKKQNKNIICELLFFYGSYGVPKLIQILYTYIHKRIRMQLEIYITNKQTSNTLSEEMQSEVKR